ncbi:hypothetical protein IG631_22657 [Alternaria alternata]|nr:hypothetical protein IG631_22657 [Alternaria alternata]
MVRAAVKWLFTLLAMQKRPQDHSALDLRAAISNYYCQPFCIVRYSFYWMHCIAAEQRRCRLSPMPGRETSFLHVQTSHRTCESRCPLPGA